jgi:hypothetical protein
MFVTNLSLGIALVGSVLALGGMGLVYLRRSKTAATMTCDRSEDDQTGLSLEDMQDEPQATVSMLKDALVQGDAYEVETALQGFKALGKVALPARRAVIMVARFSPDANVRRLAKEVLRHFRSLQEQRRSHQRLAQRLNGSSRPLHTRPW